MVVERYFATVEGRWGARQVHYRRMGSGPAVLLLHQSPQSSAEYENLLHAWSADFTVIAPDHPGYGLSDPLGSAATLDDFADATAEFLTAIQVDKTAVYGFHTGAGVAVALADRHPDKISAVYANGYVVLSDAEREHILSEYLPPFVPAWDGSHLNWVWSRNHDQLVYFPWFDRRLEARVSYTLPPPEILQQWLIELLRAGDNYRVAYHAAFQYRGEVALKTLAMPAIITATRTDVLREHLNKITQTADRVEARLGGTLEDNLAEASRFFQQNPGSNPPLAEQPNTLPDALRNHMVSYAHGNLRATIKTSGAGRPVLLLHGAARSSACITELATAIGADRPVVLLDLPGHGESDSWPADIGFMDVAEQAITAVLEAFDLDSVDAWGEWGGGTVLCEYLRRHPGRISRLAITGVQLFDSAEVGDLVENYAPPIKLTWHGGHLQEYWHRVRNESLFWPWYRQDVEHIIHGAPRLDAADLTCRVLAAMQSADDQQRVHAELFTYPLADSLRDLSANVLLSTASWDPNQAHSLAAAKKFTACKNAMLPDDQKLWAKVLCEFFAGAE